jgi:hypothetical protein
MPAARSLRSPLLVTAELRPLWLDVVPPAGQRGGETAGRSKAVPSPIALPSVPAGEGVVAAMFTFFTRGGGFRVGARGTSAVSLRSGKNPRGGRRVSDPGGFYRVWVDLYGV